MATGGSEKSQKKRVSICVLTYGNHLWLAKQCISSVIANCDPGCYELIVGANAVCIETLTYLEGLRNEGRIDKLIVSQTNLNQCPMMRKMIEIAQGEFIWWFDDDSYITDQRALSSRLDTADKSTKTTVIWGQEAFCRHKSAFTYLRDPGAFVRSASWYQGLPPPSWKVGGKGEFNFEGKGTGDGNWEFILGGEWFMRKASLRELDWPDRRLERIGSDVFLGEAIRQQGWLRQNIGKRGVAVNTEPRRGEIGLGFID